MQNKSNEISERLLNFGAEVIKLLNEINKTKTGLHIGGQLSRAATSSGANYEEACSAESRADFIHKMQIVLKELKESQYWLKLIIKSDLYRTDRLNLLSNEVEELIKIIAKSVITAKKKRS